MNPKIMSSEEAIQLIPDNATICVGGAGAGHGIPDKILESLGETFTKEGRPKNLTIINPCGVGDNKERGLNHIAFEGLVKRDIGGFWGNAPKMVKLAQENKIEGYNLPQGVLSHLMRATAAGSPGVITTTGLHTFVDPRLEGGKINERTKDDLIEVITIQGKEYLFYKAIPINVAIIRGTSIDKEGNLSMEEEVGTFAMLSMAQAARRNKGKVLAQVKKIFPNNHTDPVNVKVPGVFIDAVVVEPAQQMTFLSDYEPALVKRNVSYIDSESIHEDAKKVIAKRGAMELFPGAFVNLGYGMPDGVPIVAKREGILKELIFMIEQGGIAGIPTTGLNFGAMYNPTAIVDDLYQFDYFHGGGLDIAFLGFAQIDQQGNVNSSRFGSQITGCGGAIDISQNTHKIIFCGTFAAKSNVVIKNNNMQIIDNGKIKKFVKHVEQITFSGNYAIEKDQKVLYVTERAVFELTPEGLKLNEIAPGINLRSDVLNMMDFKPIIPKDIKTMDRKLFSEEMMNLKALFSRQ